MNELQNLAARARTGDAIAAAELRERLEGPLAYLVRRAMRADVPVTALERRVRAELGRTSPVSYGAQERDRIAGRVARRICDGVVNGPPPVAAHALMETVRM
jgi:hypothetical protein